jgi:hypothetical protein
MLGMHNEGDISIFWIAVLVFGSWTVRYLFDTIENIRVAKHKAEKARWDSVNRVQPPAIPVHEASEEINEEEEIDDRLPA